MSIRKKPKKRIVEGEFRFNEDAMYLSKDFEKIKANLLAAGYELRLTRKGTHIFEKFAPNKTGPAD